MTTAQETADTQYYRWLAAASRLQSADASMTLHRQYLNQCQKKVSDYREPASTARLPNFLLNVHIHQKQDVIILIEGTLDVVLVHVREEAFSGLRTHRGPVEAREEVVEQCAVE